MGVYSQYSPGVFNPNPPRLFQLVDSSVIFYETASLQSLIQLCLNRPSCHLSEAIVYHGQAVHVDSATTAPSSLILL